MLHSNKKAKGTLNRLLTGCFTTGIVTVICTLLGGFVVTPLILEGLFKSWDYLGSPPETAEKIVSAHVWYIEVQTESGSIYSMNLNDPARNWTRVDSVTPYDPNLEEFHARLARPFPQKTKDQIAFSHKPESTFNVRYAIADDGGVYRWADLGDIKAVTYGVLVGFFGGLCLGGIFGIFLALR